MSVTEPMLAKELAKTGVFVPEIGIGTWSYQAGPEPLRKGLERGALFIDTAESYGSESVVGEALRGLRHNVFVATKVSASNFHPTAFRKSADASLQRIGITSIDLLQLHEPNLSIPIEDTMGAMEELIDAGKVRFAGVSNFSVAQLQQAQKAFRKYPIVSNQVRYSLIDRTIEKGLLQYCQTHGVTVIAYSPLARNLGRIRDCDPTGVLDELTRMTGKSVAQIVLNWCLCKDGVIAIPKGNSEAHILDNCGATGWRLSAEQIALLDARIQYRHRGRFDELVRRYMPRALHAAAVRTVRLLPRSLRQRIN